MKLPRIALFSDSYHEVNSIAQTAVAIEACARRRNIPLLSVHPGPETQLVHDGSIVSLDLVRSRLCSFGLEHGLRFDPSMWRHAGRAAEIVQWFAPDVLHFTGPGDVGQLGAYLGHRLSVPMVASWHTNLHECASRRLRLGWASTATRENVKGWVERHTLQLLMVFYRIPRVVLAPNAELAEMLETATGKPTFLMARGVNTERFTPARRKGANSILNIGYVGRLSPEKNVRLLHTVESQLDSEGLDVRFTMVGDGSEAEWLRQHMLRAEFTGVLRGEALADAYAQMDIFAVPSKTDTVGNSALEAMASGVPAVIMATGGQRFVVETEQTAIVADGPDAFAQGVRALVKDRRRREAMGVAARAHALELLSSDRIFIDMCDAYEAAIAVGMRDRRMHEPAVIEALPLNG
jgi:phosphatidylinositol alpha 1,6-mannosyltransferase